jgi:hypothetical protein
MTEPSTVTVGPNLPKRLIATVLGVTCMVGSIILISLLTGGLGAITAWACVAAVSFGFVMYGVGTVRQRPVVVITPHGFTVHRFIGSDSHKWEDIDGQFVVTKMSWLRKVVGYRLTGEFNTRAIVGDFRCSPEELAALLNEHKQRSLFPPTRGPKGETPP